MPRIKKSFDRATGQAFTQWEVPGPRAMSGPWNRQRSPWRHTLDFPPKRETKGSAPLVDICVRVAVQHIDQLKKEYLQQLPHHVLGRIWECIKQTESISLETWKLLATTLAPTYTSGEAGRYTCPLLVNHFIAVAKRQPIAAYIEPLISDAFEFLTHISITSNVHGNTAELLQLVQLKNLAILEFTQDDTGQEARSFAHLTDSVLREWSMTPGAFPLLRILKIWGNDCTTKHSLRYISVFPSLVLYDVAGELRDWQDTDESVWKGHDETWKSHLDKTILKHARLLNRALIPDHLTKLTPAPFARDNPSPNPQKSIIPEINLVPSETDTSGASHGLKDRIRRFYESENTWAFVMYSYIGTLLSNRDFSSQGLDIGENALGLGELSFPPRPMINIILHPGLAGFKISSRVCCLSKNIFRRFETQITFVRYLHGERQQEAPKTAPAANKAFKRPSRREADQVPDKIRARKRLKTLSLLESFSKG
ncbi:hypothetical protein RRF57_001313 [Xylaria bambusicola]|uniref:Uncharacterized protein n=1 Tax=Xylaria bambusicola TaxID=326684 RepID=A0AAN7Z1H6_9PEZI